MMNEKNLLLLEEMIKSGNYDIDNLLNNIPDSLLDVLKEKLKNDLKNTNDTEVITREY